MGSRYSNTTELYLWVLDILQHNRAFRQGEGTRTVGSRYILQHNRACRQGRGLELCVLDSNTTELLGRGRGLELWVLDILYSNTTELLGGGRGLEL